MKRLMLAAALAAAGLHTAALRTASAADLIVTNAKVATMTKDGQFAQAVAIDKGLITAVGSNAQVLKHKTAGTQVIDAGGRTVIPGLNDSHLHIIREGLNYNAELRWDGVTSKQRALQMLKEQAARTPEGQWIKVVGGWNEYQFDEKRMPTLDEINAAVPDKPVFILYLYGLGFLNKKGIEVLGYDKDTRYKEGVVELGADGKPTGLLVAKPNAMILYTTLAKTGMLPREQQVNSTLQYYRELNRLGITSAIDAGGGGQAYPDDYAVSLELAKDGKLTVRTSYYLFAQKPGKELEDYQRWLTLTKPDKNDHLFYANGYNTEGGGENLVWSAADFENFLEPRPDMPAQMENELEGVLRLLVKNRWPFRIHATYGESIERDLAVIEKVDREVGLNGLRWFFDHAETISDAQLARVKTWRRHRRAGPDVLPGRSLLEALRRADAPDAANPHDAEDGYPGGAGHGRHARLQLCAVAIDLLGRDGQDGGRVEDLAGQGRADPLRSLEADDPRQCLDERRGKGQGHDRARPVRGPGDPAGGLLHDPGGAHSQPGSGGDDRQRQGRVRRRPVRALRAAGTARAAGMEPGEGVWRLSEPIGAAPC